MKNKETIKEELKKLADLKYKKFHSRIMPWNRQYNRSKSSNFKKLCKRTIKRKRIQRIIKKYR